MTAHFLDAEALIIARLKERVKGLVLVAGAEAIEGLEEQAQRTPAIYVTLDTYTPTRSVGVATEWDQTWNVTVAVRNASQGDGGATREDAGPFLSAALKALQGWRPSPNHSALALKPNPRPRISNGFGYFPLSFTCRVVSRGDTTGE